MNFPDFLHLEYTREPFSAPSNIKDRKDVLNAHFPVLSPVMLNAVRVYCFENGQIQDANTSQIASNVPVVPTVRKLPVASWQKTYCVNCTEL